jgi:hypothetical protein
MKLDPRLRAELKRANDARDFPTNTCPASRHLHMIAEALIKGKPYPMLHEEPVHCGQSMLSVVTSLFELRTEHDKLLATLPASKDSSNE